ncbi:hypothetical protein BDAP_002270 [Binucleata daphniae]
MNINKIVTLLKETHNNQNVIDFYTKELNENNTNLPEIDHKFDHEIINTCLYLLYLSNKIQNKIILQKKQYQNRDTDIITELTFFSLVGPLLTENIKDETLAMNIFSVMNEYFFELNTECAREFSMKEIVERVKEVKCSK